MFTCVAVDVRQIERIREAHALGHPVIYMPLHRSHMDYTLLTWTAFHFNLPIMHVASGENLNLSGLGFVLRRLGGFFIRRRLEDGWMELRLSAHSSTASLQSLGMSTPAATPTEARQRLRSGSTPAKDYIYRSVLHSYIEQLMLGGETIEFYAEGTRTRTGRPLLPKAGLFSVLMEAFLGGSLSDAVLIPCSVTYERLAEGTSGYARQLTGARKPKESMANVLRNWMKALTSPGYGAVAIEFEPPVLLSVSDDERIARSKFCRVSSRFVNDMATTTR